MIVVDTSVWISFLRCNDTEPVRKLKTIRPTSNIVVGDLIPLEVLQGARASALASRLESDLRNFKTAEMMDDDIAVIAARNYRNLRSSGATVRRTIDLIIATFCIAEGPGLLHDDRDFLPFQQQLGLRCL